MAMVMKICAPAYKSGSPQMEVMTFARATAALISAVGLLTVFAVTGARAQHGQASITCTNPYSGTRWQINVDYDRSTVDSSPAHISEETISWQAENGWRYSLDRKSGKLTVTLASSTGGNFLHDQCKPDQ
jgi:hypothetical protein